MYYVLIADASSGLGDKYEAFAQRKPETMQLRVFCRQSFRNVISFSEAVMVTLSTLSCAWLEVSIFDGLVNSYL